MPKDATKNVDRYKVRGGSLNEFDFHERQEEFATKGTKNTKNTKGTKNKQSTKGATTKKGAARKATKK